MLRRSIALVVFLAAAYIAIRARQGDMGMLSPAALICAIVIAIVAFAGILFNLPFARRYPREEFGMSSSLELGVGSIGILIFAAVPIFIAVRGVYTGVLPALGSGPDITFANSPMQFLGIFFLWLAGGLGVSWLLVQVRRANAGKSDKDNDV